MRSLLQNNLVMEGLNLTYAGKPRRGDTPLKAPSVRFAHWCRHCRSSSVSSLKMNCMLLPLLVFLFTASSCKSQERCEFDALYCSLQSEILTTASLDFLKVIFPDNRLSPRFVEVRTTMTISYPVNATKCDVGGDIEGIVSLGAATGQQNSSALVSDVTAVTNTTWYWAHRWSKTILLQLVLKADLWRKVGLTHSLTTVLLIANTGTFRVGGSSDNIPLIYLSPRLFMPCKPSQDATKLTWSYLLQWVRLDSLFFCFGYHSYKFYSLRTCTDEGICTCTQL